jgi:tellurite resistance protein
VAYFRQGTRQVLADLRDAVAGPFVPLALITPMLLGAALYPYAAVAGQVIVGVFAALTVLAGGLLTGQWIAADLDPGDAHPGYFLPTVTGGFVVAAALAQVGFRSAGWAAFGIGAICWLLLGSLLLNRLFFRAQLPDALTPTLAIELAPPAVGGLAWLALGGSMTGTDILGGYTVLMALVQVRMIPKYARLRFGPAFWAFTFAYAATASYALDWLNLKRPTGYQAYAVIVLALITGFVGIVAVRSLILLAQGRFLPPGLRPASAASPDAGSA